nr:MAG TPA: hypothetical protein [Caudoviricetes sp.]
MNEENNNFMRSLMKFQRKALIKRAREVILIKR